MDTPPNKNVEALVGIRQVNPEKDGQQFDFEVENAGGYVLLHIKGKPKEGFPGVTLRLDAYTACTLGVALVAKSEGY